MSQDTAFDRLVAACSHLAHHFPEGLVFIGGMATYLHCAAHDATRDLAETTHDADLYISMADLVDLREMEDITSNQRLQKHHLVKDGFDFDIYTQRQSSLPVPYDEVAAHSQSHDLFRVACLEHLLVLKMSAYADRRGSSKGEKDARDIVRIAILSAETGGSRLDLVDPYWTQEDVATLRAIGRGPAPLALMKGNPHKARAARQVIAQLSDALDVKMLAPPPPCPPGKLPGKRG